MKPQRQLNIRALAHEIATIEPLTRNLSTKGIDNMKYAINHSLPVSMVVFEEGVLGDCEIQDLATHIARHVHSELRVMSFIWAQQLKEALLHEIKESVKEVQ